MATRGSAILITEEFVGIGPEFNGDMYPEGHGNNFLKLLSEVKDNTEFIIFNNRFNKNNFGYEGIMSFYRGKFEAEEFINEDTYLVKLITNKVYSDWVFIKNATGNKLPMKDANGKEFELLPNETIRLYFGELVAKGKHKISA